MTPFIRKTLLAGGLAFAAAFSPSLADSFSAVESEESKKGFYANLGAGLNQITDIDIDSGIGGGKFEFDSGFTGNVGFGYDFGSLRTEFNYKNNSADLTAIQGTTVAVPVDIRTWELSAAYDFRSNKNWQPYVSLGIGTSEIEVEVAKTVGSVAVTVGDDDVTTGSAKLGITYAGNEKFDIYGEVWGETYSDFSVGSLLFENVSTSGITLGTRIRF